MHYILPELDACPGGIRLGPIPEDRAEYLRRAWGQARDLPLATYLESMVAIPCCAAKTSYLVEGDFLGWCVEFVPGLLVVRFHDHGAMDWVALRSPCPSFGGREATPEDMEAYDEDAPNLQYRLIYDAWDAHFDAERAEDRGFHCPRTVDEEAAVRFYQRAIDRLNALAPPLDSADAVRRCLDRIEELAGAGIAL